MKIKISQKQKPFSHSPGTFCLVPKSKWALKIYPSYLEIFDMATTCPIVVEGIPLNIEGPVDDFTVTQDLERGCVEVRGHTRYGFRKYYIFASEEKLELYHAGNLEAPLLQGKSRIISLVVKRPAAVDIAERLSLGVDKKLDWDMVTKRADLKEILPIWLRVGLLAYGDVDSEYHMPLIEDFKALVEKGHREGLEDVLQQLFKAAFHGIMVPRTYDDQHQGIITDDPDEAQGYPLAILQQTTALIRALFINVKGNSIDILPVLPISFHCGRYLNIPFGDYGTVDLEWSKKQLRRLIFGCKKDAVLHFSFQKNLKTFRLTTSLRGQGDIEMCGQPLEFQAGRQYIFDNFEK
ncbi:MAG: hypothetical protein ACQEP8_05925 [Chlamydiota bacterium]